MTTQFVTVNNLHAPDFSIGVEFPDKISLVVGDGLLRLSSGLIGLDEAAVAAAAALATTNVLSATGSVLSSVVNGVESTTDLAPLVDALVGDAVEDIAYDAATGIWTVTKADGTTSTIATPIETFLDSSAFDAATNILSLTLTDGNVISVDLAGLVDVTVLADGDTTVVTGDGSTTTPYITEAKLDPLAGNLLTASAAGLLVDPSNFPATTNTLVSADNTLTSTVDGVAADAPIINTNVLTAGAAAGSIKSTINGVDSNEIDLGGIVKPLADLELTDAFGVVLGYAFVTNV